MNNKIALVGVSRTQASYRPMCFYVEAGVAKRRGCARISRVAIIAAAGLNGIAAAERSFSSRMARSSDAWQGAWERLPEGYAWRGGRK
jgi:hypothetical protein